MDRFRLLPLVPLMTVLAPDVSAAEDWFVDTAGEKRNFEEVHERLNSPVGEPDPVRTIVESTLGLGLGTAWYWIADETNRVDWDNPQFKERLSGEAWRYDNNSFGINFIAHPMTGAGFYVLARTNNLGPGWSYVNSFGFSLLWELGIEFKEKVSINDQLVTPLAGLAVGEPAYRMGRWLNSVSNPSGFQHALRYTLALGESGHRLWDGIPPRSYGPTDRFGYDSDLWHRLSVEYSLALPMDSSTPEPVHAHHFSGEFAAMPGYHAEGRAERWFHQLEFSRLDLATSISSAGSGLSLDSEVIALGHYFHRYTPDLWRQLDGISTVLGVGVAYGYRSTSARGFDERYSPMSLPGLATKLWLAEGDLRLELSGRANVDFSGISALAYDDWADENPDVRGKSVLRKQGYFYGFGPSTRWELALSYRHLQLHGSAFAATVHSSEGVDRSQEELDVDERAHSTVTEWETGGRLRVPQTPLVLGIGYRGARWWSWVEGFEKTARAHQADVGLGVSF